MSKPLVFNYKEHEELRQAYKDLLDDNNTLMADNKRLRNKLANLEIKIRILEDDKKSEEEKNRKIYDDEKTDPGNV